MPQIVHRAFFRKAHLPHSLYPRASGVVGGERGAGGVVGQKFGEDDSQVGRSHSDVGSGEPDMEEERDMFEEAEEEAEEGTVEIVELDESDEGSEIEDVE